jgi:predicted enzyme related to lactoylglutathione lyase
MELIANIDVDDLPRALKFYRDGLGLTVRRRFGDFGVELAGATSSIFLLVKPAGTQPAPGAAPRDYRRHWTPVHLDFVVDDVDAACAQALAAGACLEGDIETHRWGRIAHLADPFGHGLCLLQFLNRGYDEVADA